MKLIPFEVQISDEEKDPQLLEKLLQELPGILNWAIKGCLEWQKNGLGTPQTVIDATAEYKEEEDEIGEFITQVCFPTGEVERTALHKRYVEWANACGIRVPVRPKAFTKRMRGRPGISERTSNGKRYWVGISIESCVCYDARGSAAAQGT